ncbi:RIIa domain-containing protein 1 [Taenia solium]|eukprot:TsM_000406300 transcript=TsM_000406300 gene=TsM_000406300
MWSGEQKPGLSSNPPTFGRNDARDVGALSDDQQSAMNLVRIQTRKSNEIYFREHPEISHMMNAFMRDVLEKQPDDIREYAAGSFFRVSHNRIEDFFTDPNLKQKIKAVQKENIMETRICHIANNLGQDAD